MDTQKQVIERLKQANNVLVTVSNDPSVDQLAACIGLSLVLNKLDKHATAVFSGNVPSTIEFLQPEDTIEKNTDSLRDFIISLDKSKADKLRYKVEDTVVRIFITPYRTSISDSDLDFSQGDFNVDVVLAIGVHEQKELDQAVTAHGRILHDATVITVNNQEQGGELGSIHWVNTSASSLSEMSAALALGLAKDILDEQISTALLTGIVAETNRFSNEKTSAETMNVSASLMAAGANQQLVATKLQDSVSGSNNEDTSGDNQAQPAPEARASSDGTLEINHDNDEKPASTPPEAAPAEEPAPAPESPVESPQPENMPELGPARQTDMPPQAPQNYKNPREMVSPPPFSSDTDPNLGDKPEPYVDPLTLPPVDASPSILSHDAPTPPQTPTPNRDLSNETLQDIEQEVHSPHLHTPSTSSAAPQRPKPTSNGPEELNLDDLQRPSGIDETPATEASVDAARDAVAAAMQDSTQALDPIAALSATPLGGPLHGSPQVDNTNSSEDSSDSTMPLPPAFPPIVPPSTPVSDDTSMLTADQPLTMPLPGTPPLSSPQQNNPVQPSPNAAPPVPPPIVPPFPGQ